MISVELEFGTVQPGESLIYNNCPAVKIDMKTALNKEKNMLIEISTDTLVICNLNLAGIED